MKKKAYMINRNLRVEADAKNITGPEIIFFTKLGENMNSRIGKIA